MDKDLKSEDLAMEKRKDRHSEIELLCCKSKAAVTLLYKHCFGG